jgi:hypothetical protein
MGKGVLVKYHSFDENGLETVQEKTVLKVYVLTIPGFNGGPDSDYLVLSNQNTVMVPPDEFNFVEFNDKSYHLRNISDLNICCNDIQTELDLTDID